MSSVNVLQLLVSVIGGLSTSLIAYGALFVRGDLSGVMGYLHARAALRRLQDSGADADQVQSARDALHALGEQVGHPEIAVRLLPLALLVGLGAGVLLWRAFGHKAQTEARPDVQERMVYRLAHRQGGRFSLADLRTFSPLTEEQAHAVTRHMLDRGRLIRDGEEFRLT